MTKMIARWTTKIVRLHLLCFGLCLVSAGCGDSGPKVVMPEKPTPLPDESARFGSPSATQDGGSIQSVPPQEMPE